MQRIDGYFWEHRFSADKADLNLAINPKAHHRFLTLLREAEPESQFYVRFKPLPNNSPRHYDADHPMDKTEIFEIRLLGLCISPHPNGFIGVRCEETETVLTLSRHLISAFEAYLQECQEDAYSHTFKIPLAPPEDETFLYFWTWHQGDVVFL